MVDKEAVTGEFESEVNIYLDGLLGSNPNYGEWENDTLNQLVNHIPTQIVDALHKKNNKYKYTAVCLISKKNQQNPKMDSACMWNQETDIYISVCKDTRTYFLVVNIYATLIDNH